MIPITQVILYRPSMAALPDENGAEDANTMAVTTTPQDAAEMIIGQMSLEDLDRLQVKVADRRTVVLNGDQVPASYDPATHVAP